VTFISYWDLWANSKGGINQDSHNFPSVQNTSLACLSSTWCSGENIKLFMHSLPAEVAGIQTLMVPALV